MDARAPSYPELLDGIAELRTLAVVRYDLLSGALGRVSAPTVGAAVWPPTNTSVGRSSTKHCSTSALRGPKLLRALDDDLVANDVSKEILATRSPITRALDALQLTAHLADFPLDVVE